LEAGQQFGVGGGQVLDRAVGGPRAVGALLTLGTGEDGGALGSGSFLFFLLSCCSSRSPALNDEISKMCSAFIASSLAVCRASP